MPDIYIKFNDTFDGNGALYCDNDALISLYTDVASIINVPVMMEVRLINKRGVLSVILRIQLTYLSKVMTDTE